TVKLSDSPYIFDIDITVKSEHHTANVRIVGHHTNIVHTEKDGEILLDTCADTPAESTDSGICDRSAFSVKTILEFVECAELCDI
ncbi:serine dehydratase subunit alpha family protein, partial [Xanthomonas citri pv. citri]|nr:serine dehydratase subunit alpha family protein [Xanthomonas citri pv. citri]